MDDPIVLEIEEDARSQPQYSLFDPVTCEVDQILQPRPQGQRPPIDPKLLVAIENGNLISFKKLLGTEEAPTGHNEESIQIAGRGISALYGIIYGGNTARHVVTVVIEIFKKLLRIEEAPTGQDEESILVAGRAFSGLCGVTCGGNTALHVVAALNEKLSPMATYYEHLNLNLQPSSFPLLLVPSVEILVYSTQSLVISLLHSISFVFPVKKFFKRIAAESVKSINELRTMKWKQHKVQIAEQAETTRLFKWLVRSIPCYTIIYRRRIHLAIAETIYRENKTLLSAMNHAMETPLHCAAKAGKLEMVSLLINFAREEGTSKLKEVLRARNHVGETALHEAACSGYSEIVKELLDADEVVMNSDAEVLNRDENLANLLDHSGASPLYLAVGGGCLDVVKTFIASNALASYAGPDEQTALHAAVLKQEEEIIRVIYGWKQSLATATDKAKNTPLHYAALIGNHFAVRELLSIDTESVYEKNLSGSSPVHIAAEAGNFTVIREILRSCPDAGELVDKENRNFLHVAVEKKRTGVIKLVCHAAALNANVMNAKDKDGNTPLHLAVKSSNVEIFALLSQNRTVNLNIRNKDGLTPLDISTSLQDHQFTYSLIPQSIIHRALLTRDAFQNPCQPDISRKAKKLLDNGGRADCPNNKKGNETSNAVGIDLEKESTKYENMSKSLITGSVLIASAAFVAIFTVSGIYRSDNTSHTLINRKNVFQAFIIADVLAVICAIVSTTWLLYSALTNLHLKYRKFYFRCCTPMLYGAINLFILTFGLGGYIAIAPLFEWLGTFVFVVSVVAIILNIIWNPQFVPLILLAPYLNVESDEQKSMR